MNDIIGTMFNKAFLEELLKPQELYSHRALKTVLTRLAHASIMRLNSASMDRLYELMVMAFKHQALLCPRPRDLLLISYNHMDNIKQFVSDTPAVLNQVNETHRKIIEVYTTLLEGEFQLLRQTLLIFLQDMHVRVALFLRNNVQNPNGRFALPTSGPVPHGTIVPGLIRIFNIRGREVRHWEFPSGGNYTSSISEGSLELFGDRVTSLGFNMYSVSKPEETHTSKSSTSKTQLTHNPLAKEELNLLARLMGGMRVQHLPNAETGFWVNLFTTDKEEEEAATAGSSGGPEDSLFGVINIQATLDVQSNSELARIAEEFAEQGETSEEHSNKGDDLLAMMDDL